MDRTLEYGDCPHVRIDVATGLTIRQSTDRVSSEFYRIRAGESFFLVVLGLPVT